MQVIKDQLALESKWEQNADIMARMAQCLANDAIKFAHRNRFRGDTQSEIYNNTVQNLMDIGWSFETAKVAAGYAVVRP
jgi:hypothetical protein